MESALDLPIAFAVGVALGAAYFAALWYTVRTLISTAHPALWLLGSLTVRQVVAVGGLYWVSGGQWAPLVTALGGFLVARIMAVRCVGGVPPAATARREA